MKRAGCLDSSMKIVRHPYDWVPNRALEAPCPEATVSRHIKAYPILGACRPGSLKEASQFSS